jgi:hypothetical protein
MSLFEQFEVFSDESLIVPRVPLFQSLQQVATKLIAALKC